MKSHKLFLILSFTLLSIANIFGQAAVEIPLSATDGTYTYQLAVGLDLTATNGIDEQLGEYRLPGPPPGVFGIAFDLSPYTGQWDWTFKDYRPPGDPPSFPFTGMIEHTLLWTWTSTLIDIMYNLPYGTQMVITDVFNGSFLNLGPFTGQGTATIPITYTQWMNKAFLRMQYDNIVPVELTSFTSSILQNEKAIQLNWTTATETNNSGFEIQRTSPLPSPYQGEVGEAGRGWEKIGFVPGFGTTTEPKSYSFIDENVTTETYKYRLKQIDFDGTFEYSNEIDVEVDFTPTDFVLYQNYPNPFNPNTVISYQLPVNSNVTLKVYDILGNEVATLVNEEKQPGVYEVEFDGHSDEGQNLSSGVYYYVMRAVNPSTSSGQSFIATKKFVLLK